ncbi:hypothetical protein DF3PB_5620002 [uncultured Defluviicoccus sp.]|uniref:Uncharacterized protein n=1 Tax=metagenome TaxID=256318 RepID=A0A380TIA5_9ZZZZ|nr:hypothetical protein DF3PB_5620002 [uncultured Defluviicoccus sp.]
MPVRRSPPRCSGRHGGKASPAGQVWAAWGLAELRLALCVAKANARTVEDTAPSVANTLTRLLSGPGERPLALRPPGFPECRHKSYNKIT